MRGPSLSSLLSWRRVVLLAVGIALVGLLVVFSGAGEIGSSLAGLGPVYLQIVLLSLVASLFQAIAWGRGSRGSFFKLWKLRVGGQSLDALSPYLPFKGDSWRVSQLSQKGPDPAVMDSVIADRGVRWLAGVVVAWGSLVAGFLLVPFTVGPVRWVLLSLTLGVGLFLGVSAASRRPGFFAAILNRFSSLGLPIRTSPAVLGRLEETDRAFSAFHRSRCGAFTQSFFFHLLAQAVSVAEVWLIGRGLLADFSISQALVLSGLCAVVPFVLGFIPGSLGILEAALAGWLVLSLGSAGLVAGVALGLARRLRAFVVFLFGFVFVGNPLKLFGR